MTWGLFKETPSFIEYHLLIMSPTEQELVLRAPPFFFNPFKNHKIFFKKLDRT